MNRATMAVVWGVGLAASGCSNAPGRPGRDSEVISPSHVMDFKTLYAENCAGCHGPNGQGGGSISLRNPVFLAIADNAAIRRTTADGVPGTPMPAFSQHAGGLLTDLQIDVIISGIRSWENPAALRGQIPPPYTASSGGDSRHGAEVFVTFCSSCHGFDGKGSSRVSSIVNGSYLALTSDQSLRTTVIAGVPELGSPDWRSYVSGRPMSSDEVADVVAWLASQRPRYPGQPYASPSEGFADRQIP